MDKEKQYEQFLGIKTDEEQIVFGNTKKLKYSLYEASEYEGLEQIFDLVSLKPEDTLVDFGCGMGRVLFYCNQRFFCKVKGIEYDRKIFEKLLDNAEFYHVRFGGQREKFTLLNMKAEDYDIAPEDTCFYFFNPFSKNILEDVLARIIKSVDEHPRRVTIIFYYCTYDMMSAIREFPCKLEHIVKLPEYRLDPDEKAYVYSYEVGE
ncbi:MAG: SAM-dependent methyltransferase [Lachnospiraceae bacterium]|nr:SAM-dependent methyltransferase [Lachnospiraceae bacterium]